MSVLRWVIVVGGLVGVWQVCADGPSFDVYGTREGLVGRTTASGLVIQESSKFVALPSRSALRREVEVTYGGKTVRAPVLDVGPWVTNDKYWETKGGVPRVVKEKMGNQAGIDLSNAVWDELGIPREAGKVKVTWRFVTKGK